jgi:23S rRNA pseudouridine1911/1915/1917 synthase
MKLNSEKENREIKSKSGTADLIVTEETELMKFLILKLPGKSRNNIKSLLANKQVFVDGKAIKQFNHPLNSGQQVSIRWSRIPEEKKYRGISIVYEDAHIVVIDKHAGLLSIATNRVKTQTAYNMLSRHVKSQNVGNKIFVVHRLDRETSGLMMFAKSEKVQQLLQSGWNDLIHERTYIALIQGIPDNNEGTITSYLRESKAMIVYSSQNPKDGTKAITHYKVIKTGKDFSLLEVNLETGKKNQVRVHMQDMGHPVVGDKKYGSKINPLGRLGLHAMVLAFRHPVSHEDLRFETPIPRKFMRIL